MHFAGDCARVRLKLSDALGSQGVLPIAGCEWWKGSDSFVSGALKDVQVSDSTLQGMSATISQEAARILKRSQVHLVT